MLNTQNVQKNHTCKVNLTKRNYKESGTIFKDYFTFKSVIFTLHATTMLNYYCDVK